MGPLDHASRGPNYGACIIYVCMHACVCARVRVCVCTHASPVTMEATKMTE